MVASETEAAIRERLATGAGVSTVQRVKRETLAVQ
jgi:hypothetical protein